ncbi:porphobilinogen deaminase-like [Centruroides sculpturatus]|uniref:porphobilinogen deaminase-like n=1 Tax=Centruroides sculpturatus TaxID=218467 RepID=UPI000C6D9AA0|nr:porphobilinogen deaminase-like [Centruroides sculpturatus]
MEDEVIRVGSRKSQIGEKSLFTKELEIALENREVDFVVHSLKDLPTTLPEGMVIGAVCKREDPSDAVILHEKHSNHTLSSLPAGSVIGTSSLRRRAQLQSSYPHLKFKSVRGNLNTRLRKLDEEQLYDGLILAVAGISRMGFSNRISQILDHKECMHAVGQGALAVECRKDDINTLRMASVLTDRDTALQCIAERSLMKSLGGGCSVPIAVYSQLENCKLNLKGGVFSLNGSDSLICEEGCILQYKKEITEEKLKEHCGIINLGISEELSHLAEQLGIALADRLLRQGARKILDEAHRQNELSIE